MPLPPRPQPQPDFDWRPFAFAGAVGFSLAFQYRFSELGLFADRIAKRLHCLYGAVGTRYAFSATPRRENNSASRNGLLRHMFFDCGRQIGVDYEADAPDHARHGGSRNRFKLNRLRLSLFAEA
jgi:hypothetical protein